MDVPLRSEYLPKNATVLQRTGAVSELREYHAGLAHVIDDLEWLTSVKMSHRLGMFWYVMVIMVRFFRGFSGQPRIATIGRTVGVAAADIFHLAIILLVTFMNFVLGGCVLFGAE